MAPNNNTATQHDGTTQHDAATLHDGASIDFEVHGDGPALLLPVNPIAPPEGPATEQMRAWGADPALGHTLVEGFSRRFRVFPWKRPGSMSFTLMSTSSIDEPAMISNDGKLFSRTSISTCL